MKILIIMDAGFRIPVEKYGGHERLVALFAEEYYRLGHEVHLLVTKGSYLPFAVSHSIGSSGFPQKKMQRLASLIRAWRFLFTHKKDFDLIHNFGRLAYLIPVVYLSIPAIMTYGRKISKRNIDVFNTICRKKIQFTACSENLIHNKGLTGDWSVIYNSIPFKRYDLRSSIDPDASFLFIGRLEKVKGCHHAIRAVLELDAKLVIAGNISELPDEKKYFEQQLLPLIDNEKIIYKGPVNDHQKNELLGCSKALLFPIEWEEPFGMVMIEAMACGTPVIAFRNGAVSEVVQEGITGFIVQDKEEMKCKMQQVSFVDRARCRDTAYAKFDPTTIAKKYLSLVTPTVD